MDDVNVLTDAEIELLIILVNSNKEWAKALHNEAMEETLDRIHDKLDDMKNNYG